MEDQSIFDNMEAPSRQKLVADGAMSAYKLTGMCTLMAAYDVSPCLEPKCRMEFQNGFKALGQAKKKNEELQKTHDEAC